MAEHDRIRRLGPGRHLACHQSLAKLIRTLSPQHPKVGGLQSTFAKWPCAQILNPGNEWKQIQVFAPASSPSPLSAISRMAAMSGTGGVNFLAETTCWTIIADSAALWR